VRVLVSSIPGLGHLHPVLPVALAAAAAGHDVRVATGANRLEWVERCGATGVAAGLPHDELVSSALALPAPERARRMFTTVAVPPMAQDLLDVVDRWAPDVLLHEEGEYAAPLVAELTGPPSVTHSWPSPARPDAGRRLLDEALRDVWDAAGAEGGVRQVGDEYLDSCPPLLQGDGLAAVDAPITPVRPTGFDGPVPRPAWLASLPRPAVYVTLGTEPSFSRPELLQRLVDAAAAAVPGVVVSTGPHLPEVVRSPHSGVHAVQYLPQSLVLPAVDAVVCHGGAGTTAGALLHGLAVLVVPGPAPSQQAAAARVDAAGLGQHLPWEDAEPGALVAAVRRLLDRRPRARSGGLPGRVRRAAGTGRRGCAARAGSQPLARSLQHRASGPRARGGQAVTRPGRCGGTTRPSGSSSPVSSKTTTASALHSRFQPCSGWRETIRASSWSGASAGRHGGECGQLGVSMDRPFPVVSVRPGRDLHLRRCPCMRRAGPTRCEHPRAARPSPAQGAHRS
jgi:UDP:flavonoid glycosyltransferase YjiC (YdhE family)